MTPTTLIGVTALLVLAGSYLAAAETVLARVNLVRALRLEDEDRPGAAALLWLMEHRMSAQNVLLVATVTVRIAAAGLVAAVSWRLTETGWVVLVVLAALLIVTVIIGEAVPRTVALRNLETTALRLARSVRLLVRLLTPASQATVALTRAVVPRRHEVSGPYASDEELRELDPETSEHDEQIEPEERAMIRSIFELADTRVREIMTPRPDMVMVSAAATLPELAATITERGVSRLPVHDPDDADSIVGIVYAKDLLARMAIDDGQQQWADLVREATFVPETKRGDELLRDLQAATVHMAIVVDEYGAIAGLVTIEDILEEIVGEIIDEHDQEEPLFEVLADGSLRVDARLGVDDLNDMLSASLPEDGWDTVGGLVFGTLGRVPVVGETVVVDRHVLMVESVQGRRVGKVLVAHEDRSEQTDERATTDAGVDGPGIAGPATGEAATNQP
ncbi:MAG: hemolysin family protein [Nitriliruptoraceae bacterium]